MPKYQAGILTKNKLINAAKKNFYYTGYEKATIKDICNTANVTRSSFFYYFKDKTDIADYICNEVNYATLFKIQILLDSYNLTDDTPLNANAFSASFFYAILSNNHLLRFYAEALTSHSDIILGNNFYRIFFIRLSKFLPQKPTSGEFELFFIYGTSAPGNLLHKYLQGDFPASKTDIIRYIISRPLDPTILTKHEIKDIEDESIRIAAEINFDMGKLFLEESTV
ncbi:MAG: TetR/AcrR family transcriptional regulator [Eubacteriaceae bacterium]